MSNESARRANLVESDTSGYELVAAGTVGVGVLVVALSLLTLSEIVPFEAGLAGLSMPTAFGAVLSLVGAVTVGLGVASA
ncbi:phosphate ABC transporter, permease protein PstA, partial [Halobium palmae]